MLSLVNSIKCIQGGNNNQSCTHSYRKSKKKHLSIHSEASTTMSQNPKTSQGKKTTDEYLP